MGGSFAISTMASKGTHVHLYCISKRARCGRCAEIIRGKCITAMDIKWHPDHFTCENCGKPLAGTTFVKRNGKPYCKPCLERLKIQGLFVPLHVAPYLADQPCEKNNRWKSAKDVKSPSFTRPTIPLLSITKLSTHTISIVPYARQLLHKM